MFSAEALGLSLLASEHLRTPRPYAYGDGRGEGFLLMEWIDPGRRGSGAYDVLGTGLAQLHRERRSPLAGLESDNYIGSTPQRNEQCESWIEFYGSRRLAYQLSLAATHGRIDSPTASAIGRVIARLGDLLPEQEQMSLLHGDLWGGNVMVDSNGAPVLIDPAVYYGHREADIAMTELFGGFPSSFYSAYAQAWPLEGGYDKRRDLYNLYHMLNHLNIFGGSYLGSVQSIVSRYS
jgi:fructosamine-3-kinase